MKHLILTLACLSPLLGSCQSEGAKEGATQGALYGALGAAVSSVVWGRNDVLGDAARGAVVGATVGGVHGAVNDSNRSKSEAQAEQQAQLSAENKELAQRNRQLELESQLIEEIGPDNTEAVRALVRCEHRDAVLAARRAGDSDNEHFRVAGLYLEAVTAYDRRDLSTARMLYPRLASADSETATADDAEVIVVNLVTALEDTREQFGLARRCD